MYARPFLKWAGGKSQLLNQLQFYYPVDLRKGKIKKYFEPFLGGGAVFFDIVRRYNIEKAFLTDKNDELILIYKVIQKNPKELIEFLSKYSEQYQKLSEEERKKYYYDIRRNLNQQRFQINYQKYSENWISRAAQLIILNKTCYNGLFRLNKKGEFNVPFGKYKNPKILDKDNIIRISKILQIAEINIGNFNSTEYEIDEESFVYFDPPYRPLNKTSSFTSYSKYSFDDSDQIQLSKYFYKLNRERNPKLMLSNSDPQNENPHDNFFNELFNDFKIIKVNANRMINCNAEKRGQITELLITNY